MSHFDSESSRRSSVRRSSNLKHSNSVPLLDEQTFPEPLSISKDSQSSVGSETPKIEDSDVYQRSVSVPVGLNDTLGQVLPIHADSPARERALPYTSEETLGAIGYQKNYHTAQMSTYQRLALESKPIDGEKAPPSCSLTETKADGDENVNKPVNVRIS
ncbi:uncharacterized protein LOC111083883 [Limulus polyphemus]|uniref:Uncharacterized protein LOC111083883 n=1 Tax=Limulus polyphemus TaxID=6850 RepID=A0ABM1RY54_LIMPO|nr:uncharacterized protein LOC111083883 [Limulus polyphemus]